MSAKSSEWFAALAFAELERCAALLTDVPPEVEVRWDLRGKTAGQCRRKRSDPRCILRFNRVIAEAEGDAYRKTVAHEYAHAVVIEKALLAHPGGTPHLVGAYSAHGAMWSGLMHRFGYDAQRCHAYESAERVIERRHFAYACDCKQHALSIVRHRKIVTGQAKYRCPKCGAYIRRVE